MSDLTSENVEAAVGIVIPHKESERTEFQRKLATTWGRGEHPKWEPGICKVCRKPEEPVTHIFRVFDGIELEIPSTVCDDCWPIVSAHYMPTGKRRGNLSPVWEETCPAIFRELIEGHAPFPRSFDFESYKRVLDWNPTERRGLFLRGDSGAGKTTSAWALFRKIEQMGLVPVLVSGPELKRQLGKAARDMEGIERLCRCPALIIDDLGKEPPTPGAASMLWELINARYCDRRLTFVTTKFTGAELSARFGDAHVASDIMRRLGELCRLVEFKCKQAV